MRWWAFVQTQLTRSMRMQSRRFFCMCWVLHWVPCISSLTLKHLSSTRTICIWRRCWPWCFSFMALPFPKCPNGSNTFPIWRNSSTKVGSRIDVLSLIKLNFSHFHWKKNYSTGATITEHSGEAYYETAEQIEKWCEIGYFAMIRITPMCWIFPRGASSYFNYFFTNIGNEAFDLPLLMW